MRSPTYTSINVNTTMTNNNSTAIPQTADLKITMTTQPPSIQKRRTKYRPIARPDGLIVLQRPYQPANSPVQQPLQFEKHLPIFPISPASAKTSKIRKPIKPSQEDFAQIGGHFQDGGRDGYNGLVNAGRGGYNAPVDAATEENFDLEAGMADLTPMQRFLCEAGPWTAVSVMRG